MLGECLESLRQVRAALTQGNFASLNAALAQQGKTSRAADELRERRTKLRRKLASVLGVAPQTVTVQMLAVRLAGDTGERLTACRNRLRIMAAEVDRLNRANAALVSQSLDFLERFFVEITGGEHGGRSYDCSGTSRQSECGSIIEARG